MAEEKRSSWVKPAILGGIVGAVAISVVGLSLDWVVPQGTAQVQAEREAERAVIAALTPVCVAQFKRVAEQKRETHLAALEDESSDYMRGNYVEEQGWATMPGTSEPNDAVSEACAEELMKLGA